MSDVFALPLRWLLAVVDSTTTALPSPFLQILPYVLQYSLPPLQINVPMYYLAGNVSRFGLGGNLSLPLLDDTDLIATTLPSAGFRTFFEDFDVVRKYDDLVIVCDGVVASFHLPAIYGRRLCAWQHTHGILWAKRHWSLVFFAFANAVKATSGQDFRSFLASLPATPSNRVHLCFHRDDGVHHARPAFEDLKQYPRVSFDFLNIA
ncbi:hypothetical protein JCM6882_000711 [Rhodosporidiobolus microsporus]